jgi:hypothetical protein
MGNAIYRNLIQGALMIDARRLAIAVPVEYRYGDKPNARAELREDAYSVVEAIHGSRRLELPFEASS